LETKNKLINIKQITAKNFRILSASLLRLPAINPQVCINRSNYHTV
jgi:hypothetical protein